MGRKLQDRIVGWVWTRREPYPLARDRFILSERGAQELHAILFALTGRESMSRSVARARVSLRSVTPDTVRCVAWALDNGADEEQALALFTY
jgi:hypothetical protein